MALDPVLKELLACPCEQHAPVVDRSDESPARIECTRCLTTFPVVDDIPVMLLDEATPGPQGIGAAVTA
jgi:uncharacterized protein YbaR (Trm112 family)